MRAILFQHAVSDPPMQVDLLAETLVQYGSRAVRSHTSPNAAQRRERVSALCRGLRAAHHAENQSRHDCLALQSDRCSVAFESCREFCKDGLPQEHCIVRCRTGSTGERQAKTFSPLSSILDETYRDLLPYDWEGCDEAGRRARPHTLFGKAAGARIGAHWSEYLVHIYSFSKSYAIPGYRLGALVASPALLEQALKISKYLCRKSRGRVTNALYV